MDVEDEIILGMHPEDAAEVYLGSRGISPATVMEYGVGYDPHEQAITFPYYDAWGRQTSARWRKLHPNAVPKYMGSRGVRAGLYNVVDVDEPWVYLTEGEIDCLTLKQLGLAAVGVPGAGAFREAWRWLFVDRKVRIVFDADSVKYRVGGEAYRPGQDGGARVLRAISTVAAFVEVVHLPEGEDVNSLHMNGQLAPFVT